MGYSRGRYSGSLGTLARLPLPRYRRQLANQEGPAIYTTTAICAPMAPTSRRFSTLLHEQHASFEYDLIRRTVRLVAPFFEDFQPGAAGTLNRDKIRLEWRHKRSDAYFDASSLSDGTLRFMALATLLLQPEALRPSVILVDEPELGLHPYAISNCWPRW